MKYQLVFSGILLFVLVFWVVIPVSGQDLVPGMGVVNVSGDFAFSGQIPIRYGAVTRGIDGHSFLAFGEESGLKQLFHLKLVGGWIPEPEEATINFVLDAGVTPELLGLFFSVNTYEAQLIQLSSQEIIRGILLSGKPLELDVLEQALPHHVVADLKRLDAAKEEGYQGYRVEITVVDVRGIGNIQESIGFGVLQTRVEEDYEEGIVHFSGRFWGNYSGSGGSGTIEGDFHAVPYLMQGVAGVESYSQAWDRQSEEPAYSTLEKLWDTYYSVTGFSVGVSKPLAELSHQLRIELLGEDGLWHSVYEVQLKEGFEGRDPAARPRLEYQLPQPFRAGGVRFELYGKPFMGESWDLGVSASPLIISGREVFQEWRYNHGW